MHDQNNCNKRVLPALFHLRCPSQSHQRSARVRTRLTTVTSISCRSLWRQLLYLRQPGFRFCHETRLTPALGDLNKHVRARHSKISSECSKQQDLQHTVKKIPHHRDKHQTFLERRTVEVSTDDRTATKRYPRTSRSISKQTLSFDMERGAL